MTLQEFIDACVAEVAAREAEKQAQKDEAERQEQELFQRVKDALRRRVLAPVPQPLRQFVDYAGGNPTLDQLHGYPGTWTPSEFKVEAPGLRTIFFATSADDNAGPLRITDISVFDPSVGNTSFGTDWAEAVAAAVITTGSVK